jgi:[ribosomal protein S5]-alanine N-acetyltransferase
MELLTSRFLLRDFMASDRAPFLAYQEDPRYLELHGAEEAAPSHAEALFEAFQHWGSERPRRNYQLAVARRHEPMSLVGCCGLRMHGCGQGRAELGVELAPDYWGRYAYALEISRALLDFGFDQLGLIEIFGITANSNDRVARLATWFGATVTAHRPGPLWMTACGWTEVEWQITRQDWEQVAGTRRPNVAPPA